MAKVVAKTRKVKSRSQDIFFKSPKGMSDILPQDQPWADRVRGVSAELADFYSFREISPSVFESAELFSKLLGPEAAGDLVLLKIKKAGAVVLRPMIYPSVVRAYLEHGLGKVFQPQKFYYNGPIGETQNGSFRQVDEIGFEVIGGTNDAIYDSQVILVLDRLLKGLKLKDYKLFINSSGCKACRPAYKRQLQNYYRSYEKTLCADCSKNYAENPILLLGCDSENCREIKEKAPNFLDKLCSSCSRHFKVVLEYLDELEIVYELDSRLVSGLEHGFQTIFRFATEDGLKTLAAGDRHDYLAEAMGSKITPAIGGWLKLQDVIGAMKEQEVKLPLRANRGVFMVHVGELAKKKSLKIVEELRQSGVSVTEALGRESIKSQLKMASRQGSQLALIFGQKEVYEESIIVRDLRTGLQETVVLSKIVPEIQKRLKERPLISEK